MIRKPVSKKRKRNQELMVFAGLGFEVVGLMLGSVFIGKVIDSYLQTNGISIVILILMSFTVWLYHVIFMAKKLYKKKDESSN